MILLKVSLLRDAIPKFSICYPLPVNSVFQIKGLVIFPTKHGYTLGGEETVKLGG